MEDKRLPRKSFVLLSILFRRLKRKQTLYFCFVYQKNGSQKIHTCQILVVSSWLKRSKLSSTIRIFSDSQMAWMSQYNIFSNDDEGSRFPWSMASLTFDTSGAMLERNRNVNPSHSTQIVTDTIKKLSKK
jgi:hypothetical protein